MGNVMYCYGKHAALLNQVYDNVVKLNTVKEVLRKIDEVQEEERPEDFFVMSLGYKNLIDKEEEFESIFSSIKNSTALIYCTDEEVWEYISSNSLFNHRIKTIKQFEILKKAMILDDIKALEKLKETEVVKDVYKPVFQRRPEVETSENKEIEQEQDVLEFINLSLEKEVIEQEDQESEECLENIEIIEENKDFTEKVIEEDEQRIISEIVKEEIPDSPKEEAQIDTVEDLQDEIREDDETPTEAIIEPEEDADEEIISEEAEADIVGNDTKNHSEEMEEFLNEYMGLDSEEAACEQTEDDFISDLTEDAGDNEEEVIDFEEDTVEEIEIIEDIEDEKESCTVEENIPELEEDKEIIIEAKEVTVIKAEEYEEPKNVLSEEDIIKSLIEEAEISNSTEEEIDLEISEPEEDVSSESEDSTAEELSNETKDESLTLNEDIDKAPVEEEIQQEEELIIAETETLLKEEESEVKTRKVRLPVTQNICHDGEEFKFTPGNFFIE